MFRAQIASATLPFCSGHATSLVRDELVDSIGAFCVEYDLEIAVLFLAVDYLDACLDTLLPTMSGRHVALTCVRIADKMLIDHHYNYSLSCDTMGVDKDTLRYVETLVLDVLEWRTWRHSTWGLLFNEWMASSGSKVVDNACRIATAGLLMRYSRHFSHPMARALYCMDRAKCMTCENASPTEAQTHELVRILHSSSDLRKALGNGWPRAEPRWCVTYSNHAQRKRSKATVMAAAAHTMQNILAGSI